MKKNEDNFQGAVVHLLNTNLEESDVNGNRPLLSYWEYYYDMNQLQISKVEMSLAIEYMVKLCIYGIKLSVMVSKF